MPHDSSFFDRSHYPVYPHIYDDISFDTNHLAAVYLYFFSGDIILIEVSNYKIRQTQLHFINYFFAWFTQWNFIEVSRLKTPQQG